MCRGSSYFAWKACFRRFLSVVVSRPTKLTETSNDPPPDAATSAAHERREQPSDAESVLREAHGHNSPAQCI